MVIIVHSLLNFCTCILSQTDVSDMPSIFYRTQIRGPLRRVDGHRAGRQQEVSICLSS